jgi:hypothetical protein
LMSADITVMVLLSLILASITKREWRSTRVTIQEFYEPWIRSPSQCPGIALSATSAGLLLMGIASGIKPNPFPLSEKVLDLRTALPLLSHCCSSFFNAPGFV